MGCRTDGECNVWGRFCNVNVRIFSLVCLIIFLVKIVAKRGIDTEDVSTEYPGHDL